MHFIFFLTFIFSPFLAHSTGDSNDNYSGSDNNYVYVSPDPSICSDSNTCDGSYSSPWPDIKAGLSDVGGNDILILFPGTYTGPNNTNITIRYSYKRIYGLYGPESTIIDCEASGNYGIGLQAGSFQLINVTIQNCIGSYRDTYDWDAQNFTLGGGLWVEATYTEIISCDFINNTADLGGAIYFFSNSLIIHNSSIINNYATIKGGGVYLESGYININYSVILSDNIAGNKGGGLYMQSASIDGDIYSLFENNNIEDDDGDGRQIYCKGGGGSFYRQSGISDGQLVDKYGVLDRKDIFCESCSLVLIDDDDDSNNIDYCHQPTSDGYSRINKYMGMSVVRNVLVIMAVFGVVTQW